MLLAVATAPFGLVATGGQAHISLHKAVAADPLPGGVKPKPEVCLGLPVMGGINCVSNSKSSGGAIVGYLRLALKLLSGAVAVVVLVMIVFAGVQYIASLGDPGRIKSAKDRLQNAIIALVLFLSMYAILTFIVPGGIL